METAQLWQQARFNSLNDVIGNGEALAELKSITSGFVLIHGPMGCGKTSTALAYQHMRFPDHPIEEHQTISCPGKYFVQHVHASNFELDDTVRRKIFFYWDTPTLIICDEAQELTLKRQQSRLKTLPRRDSFTLVLVTTDPHAIEPSIRDRCAKIRLGPLSARELPMLVKRACEMRGIPYDPAIVKALNRGEIFRPRAILNTVDAIARGKSIVQAVAGQD